MSEKGWREKIKEIITPLLFDKYAFNIKLNKYGEQRIKESTDQLLSLFKETMEEIMRDSKPDSKCRLKHIHGSIEKCGMCIGNNIGIGVYETNLKQNLKDIVGGEE